ncbi:MAG: protein kinase [Terriglobales bacterium]
MAPNQVTKIGKYDVLGVLGQGGMGVVYKGVDPRIGRPVAIKMMTSGFARNEDALRRFYREAQSVGVLQHPNIVIVYDLGDEDGTPYLVMEFLDGEPLDKIIAARRELAIVEKLDVIIQTLRALEYAHQHKIVHRDVKPGNVMVMPNGNCKLVDFGIARGGDATLTHTGQIIGSMSYMSPEQLNGRSDIDGRTDIWSAGVMLYELLTYHLPFEARDTAAMIVKILNEAPPPLAQWVQNFPPELDEAINRALAKDREDRYHTAADFAFDLSHAQELLKAQMVSEYVEQARASMARSELSRARELLSRVLKVDTQNSTAKQLLYEVQQLIHKQQRGEQVNALRARAEDALKQGQWQDALEVVDQALRIDKTSLDLLGLRESILQHKARKEQVTKLVHLAEAAQKAGELDMARRAVDDALAIDPNDTQAKVLSSVLLREIEQQKRFQKLIEAVRSEVGSNHYTQAAQLLREAESLRPEAPDIAPLKSLITAGREEQLRRERLQQFTTEIEQLLGNEQFLAAQARAEEALRSFPAERGLLGLLEKCKTLQQNRWVEQQLAAADRLASEGRITAAIALLETAAASFQDSRLQGHIPVLRKRAEEQKKLAARGNAIAMAQQAIEHEDYEGAIATLQKAQAEFGRSTQIDDLVKVARAAAVEAANRRKVREAAEHAQSLLDQGDFAEADDYLSKAIAAGLRDDSLDRLLAHARAQHHEFQLGVEKAIAEASALLAQHRPDEALASLNAQPQLYSRSMDFRQLLDRARTEQNRQRATTAALADAREAMQRGRLEQAWQIVQGCRARYGDSIELSKAVAEIEGARTRAAREAAERAAAEARNKQIEEVLQHARRQMEAGELETAVAYLDNLATQIEDPALKRLREEAQTRLAEFRRGVEAAITQGRKLLDAQRPGDAVAFLESQPQAYGRSPALRALLQQAHLEQQQQQATESARHQRVQQSLEQARRFAEANDFAAADALLAQAEAQLQDAAITKMRAEVRTRRQQFAQAVDGVIAKARSLLDKGKPDEALTLLAAQPQTYNSVPQFTALAHEAQSKAATRQALTAALQQVRGVLQQGDPERAAAQLNACRAQFGDVPEIALVAAEIEKQRAAQLSQFVESTLEQAQALLKSGDFVQAGLALDGIALYRDKMDSKVLARCERLAKEIAQAQAKARAAAARPETVRPPEATPGQNMSATVISGGFTSRPQPVLATATAPARRPEPELVPAPPVAPPAKSKLPLIAGGAALLLIAAVVAYFLVRPKPEEKVSEQPQQPGPAVVETYAAIDVVPWASVTIRSADGAVVQQAEDTPLRIQLKQGDYTLELQGPKGQRQTQNLHVPGDGRGVSCCAVDFGEPSASEIVSAYGK